MVEWLNNHIVLQVSRIHGIKLDDYMQKHIFGPLGMTSTTFHPESRGLLDKIPECYSRDPVSGDLTAVPLPLILPAEEDCGGHGLFATIGDFARLLAAILSGGGEVLTKESIDQMFSPQLNHPRHLSRWAYGEYKPIIAPAIPKGLKIDYGLGGLISMEPISGRRSAGSLQWLGMVNQFWWIDPEIGIAGSVLFNLRPTGDARAWNHHVEFEKEVYSLFRN
ncbi:hypothetical protein QQZ08_000352 [Neonectria magnoliae]|uniref:Beta-lactamase-related domain-containing protein n=1 Tax=Neonectria magnoliae TaxID=2732573 RepID=A0ABR1IGW2_9HYPO